MAQDPSALDGASAPHDGAHRPLTRRELRELADRAAAASDDFARAASELAAEAVPTASEKLRRRAAEDEADLGPRRSRSTYRRVTTTTFSVGVLAAVGALTVATGLTAAPFSSPSAVAASSAATSLSVHKPGQREIQAFVMGTTPGNTGDGDRSGNYTTASLAEIAKESGINYSTSLFVNNTSAPIQWPFKVGTSMSDGFGMRDGAMHEGVDFTPGNGAPIQAIADGTVRIATENGGNYGVTVYIDHIIDGKLVTSHYAHMQYGSLRVTAGQKVTVGTVVGLTGNTGRSFGAHMHFEIIIDGSTVDPLPWLATHAGGYLG